MIFFQGFRVLVTNLHSIVTQEDVVELFSACGALKRTKMIKAGSAEVGCICRFLCLNLRDCQIVISTNRLSSIFMHHNPLT